MSAQKQYESKNVRFSENMHTFRNYVVDRSNAQQPPDKVFEKHHNELTSPEIKQVLTDYHKTFDKGFFKNGRTQMLAATLTKLYEIQLNELSKDSADFSPQFAKTILKDRAASIMDEAKNLLSGTTYFSVDLAVREIRKMRIENTNLTSINNTLNTALKNLTTNIKSKFGLKEQEIDNLMLDGNAVDKTKTTAKVPIPFTKTSGKDNPISI